MTEIHYIGEELDLFSRAVNWKTYVSQRVQSMLGAEVLEVGAGMGTNTAILCSLHQRRWLCLEPDGKLLSMLFKRIHSEQNLSNSNIETRLGTLEDVHDHETFDSILYLDVIEHIKDDKSELERAGRHLRSEGILVVMAPAHQWLYSPFDRAIGHYRRYNKKTLSSIGPPGITLKQLYYMDFAGLAASMGNLLLLRKKIPNQRQIAFWDDWLIPLSTKIDPLLRFTLGKTIIGIWQKHG